MKNLEESNNGTESHPILRVQNYKKPQLAKIGHDQGNFNFNMGHGEAEYMQNGKMQVTFQATVQFD
jgi:hypothetical protein